MLCIIDKIEYDMKFISDEYPDKTSDPALLGVIFRLSTVLFFYDKLYDFLNKNHTIYIQKHSLM